MKVSELAFDEQNRVFLNPDKIIGYSDGVKNENYIFDSLKKAKDTSIFSIDLFNCIKDWPSEYHFTTYRQNILRPLNIKKGQKVLEIGAGTGAITRYLGEVGANITAVEGSLARAKCIAERCRDLENVSVICSNAEDVEFEEKFDIVTLIGVFEYTAKYSSHQNPFNTALKNYVNLLKPNGSLVIAIENKLGLKYFAGFNEDHFATPYFGLENRYGEKDITTFGHREITGMLKNNGFESIEFLYPFPDYKLPKVIISDSGLENEKLNSSDLIKLTKNRHYNPRPKANLLNEYLVWDAIEENGLLKDMSNSFLIVASKSETQELLDKSLLAHYYTCNRLEPHNTQTSFYANGSKGITVHKNLLGNTSEEKQVGIEHHIVHESNYIPGDNLHHLILGGLYKKRFSGYEQWMSAWANFIRTETKESNSDGLPLEYFDALPFNVIIDEKGKPHLFDQEWRVEEKFNITFLVIRYLSMYEGQFGIYSGYAKGFLDFINKTLVACGLSPISKSELRRLQKKDKVIRNKINRQGGMAPLQIKKSLVLLALFKFKEVNNYLLYGIFAQR